MEAKNNTEEWKQCILALKEIAITKGMKIEDIASKAHIMPSTVKRIFELKFTPDLDVFLKIANAMQIKVGFFQDGNQFEIFSLLPKK